MAGTVQTLRVGGVPGGYPAEIDASVKVRFVDDSEIINLSDLSTDVLKYFGGVSQFTFDNQKHEWTEDDIWGRRLSSHGTLDAGADDTTDSLTVTAQAHRYPVGTILVNITHASRELVRVEAHVDADTLTVRRGYAGSTAATWAAGDTAMVAGFSMHEDDAWVYRPSYILTLPYNLHQVQHVGLKQTWNRAGTRLYGVQNGAQDFANQVMRTMAEQLVSVEQALIVGQRFAGDANEPSTSGGLEFYVTSALGAQVTDLASASVTRKDIEDLVQNLAYAVGKQNAANVILCSYWFERKVSQLWDTKERLEPDTTIAGLEIQRIRIPGLGIVSLLPHTAIPNDSAYFVKAENVKVGTFAGLGQPHVGEIVQNAGPYQGRYFYMNWSARIKGVAGFGLIKKFSLTS
jgi:hypothetical protein